MSFTGTPPFPGYPDYDNQGDATFDGNRYAQYSGDGFGVLATAGSAAPASSPAGASPGGSGPSGSGSGWSFDLPVGVSLYVRPGNNGGSSFGPYDWVHDPYGALHYADAGSGWIKRETWTVTRQTFDGNYGSYFGNGDLSGAVVATQDAPNGWTMAFAVSGDLTRSLTNQYLASNTAAGWDLASADIPGTLTVTPPGGQPYGRYLFTYGVTYTKNPPHYGGYGFGQLPDINLLGFGVTPPPGVIQTGAASLTITNDPAFPAPGTLTGAPNEYFITGTGPVYGPSAPRPPRAVLNVKLTLAGMPAETTYLGPKLLSIAVKEPPGDGSQADLDAYKAAHPSPYSSPGAMVDHGSVLLPVNPPNENGNYEWNLPWPFYAGKLTVFFVPVSYFGPVHVAPSGFVYGWPDFNGNIPPAPNPLPPYTTLQEIGLVPPFVARLHINITPWGSGGGTGTPPDPLDGGDAAQDTATGRTTKVLGVTAGTGSAMTTTLQAQAWEGWQNLAGALARPSAPILDAAGQPARGQYPSLWKASDQGAYSLCYQNANGQVVRAVSLDGLSTLMPFPGLIFTNANGSPRTGGRPGHLQDGSTGIYYVAAAFTLLDASNKPTGKEDVLIARVDATDTLLSWADGSRQKSVVLGTAAAGRPALVLNRYDPAQTLLLLHGDRKFLGLLGGEQWQEITT